MIKLILYMSVKVCVVHTLFPSLITDGMTAPRPEIDQEPIDLDEF